MTSGALVENFELFLEGLTCAFGIQWFHAIDVGAGEVGLVLTAPLFDSIGDAHDQDDETFKIYEY